jgi:MFS transporter, DHA1 family, multidrug resistance protein
VTAVARHKSPPGDARAGRPRLLGTLVAVGALDALTGLIVFGSGNTYLLEVVRSPESYPAFAIAVYGLVKLVGSPLGGWLVERTRRVTVAAVSAVATAGGLAWILAGHSADAYLIAIGLVSLGQAVAWIALFHAIGAGTKDSERGAVTARMGAVSGVGMGAGIGMAAVFSVGGAWQLPFVAGFALVAVSTVAMLGAPARPAAEPTAADEPHSAGAGSTRQRRFAATLVIFGHFATSSALVAGIAPLALRTLDLTLWQALAVLAPAAAGVVLGMFVVAPRSVPGGRLRLAAVLYGVAAAAIALAAGATGPVLLAVAAFPLGVAFGGAQPVVNASLLDAAQAERRSGVAIGYLFFVQGAGSIAGPVVVGAVIELAGIRAGVSSIAVMAVLVALGTGWGARTVRL